MGKKSQMSHEKSFFEHELSRINHEFFTISNFYSFLGPKNLSPFRCIVIDIRTLKISNIYDKALHNLTIYGRIATQIFVFHYLCARLINNYFLTKELYETNETMDDNSHHDHPWHERFDHFVQ